MPWYVNIGIAIKALFYSDLFALVFSCYEELVNVQDKDKKDTGYNGMLCFCTLGFEVYKAVRFAGAKLPMDIFQADFTKKN